MKTEYDVVILGAGTAGLSAVSTLKRAGADFLLIDPGPLGTTCARAGCMPSKSIIEASSVFHSREIMGEMGIRGSGSLEVDGAGVMNRVRDLRDGFMASSVRRAEALGDRYLRERARFKEPMVIEAGPHRISAASVIVATGSSPVVPGPWKDIGNDLLTSETVFDLPRLPKSLAVVGLGPLGLEMAQAMAGLGVDVRGYDASKTIGGLVDTKVSEEAAAIIGREFPIELDSEVRLKACDDGVEVSANGGSRRFEKVLAAVGRRPRTEDLGLESLGVEMDEQGIPLFDAATLKVSGLPVFIAGDVNGRAPLLHEASDDGRIAGYNAISNRTASFMRKVRFSIVFTHPCIASVGWGGQSWEDSGIVVGEASFSGQGRAVMTFRDSGLVRLYVSSGDARLLGAEMIAPDGEHLAHLAAWAVQRGMTVYDMLRMPFYHPTCEEGLRSAVRDAAHNCRKGQPAETLPELPLS